MLGQAVVIAVVPRQALEDGIDRRPGRPDEVQVVPGGDGIPPDLEDELRAEVDPVVDVLVLVEVRPQERIVGWPADVVGHGAARLPRRGPPRRLDDHLLLVVDRD
jgi:hypothetical protein